MPKIIEQPCFLSIAKPLGKSQWSSEQSGQNLVEKSPVSLPFPQLTGSLGLVSGHLSTGQNNAWDLIYSVMQGCLLLSWLFLTWNCPAPAALQHLFPWEKQSQAGPGIGRLCNSCHSLGKDRQEWREAEHRAQALFMGLMILQLRFILFWHDFAAQLESRENLNSGLP